MHCFPTPNHVGPGVCPPATAGAQISLNPYCRVSGASKAGVNAIDNYLKPRLNCLDAAGMASFESCASRRKTQVTAALEKAKNERLAESKRNPVYGLNSVSTSFL